MCRNIRTLFNFDPPATDDEVHAAALQYVRKVSGTRKPAKGNVELFERAVEDIARVTRELVRGLEPHAPPRLRAVEIEKAKARSLKRFARNGA
jgi:hypothetical protein